MGFCRAPLSFPQRVYFIAGKIVKGLADLLLKGGIAGPGICAQERLVAAGHRWAIALQCVKQPRIVLYIFKVSAPTIQRDCPSMLQVDIASTIPQWVMHASLIALFGTKFVDSIDLPEFLSHFNQFDTLFEV